MSAGWAVVLLLAGAALDRLCLWMDRPAQEERRVEQLRPFSAPPSNVRPFRTTKPYDQNNQGET